MRDVASGAGAHDSQRVLPLLVGRVQCERRCVIVIDGAKPVALRGQRTTALERSVAALTAEISDPDPLPIPGSGAIPRVDPACGKEAFGNHRAAFLGRP